MCGDGVRQRLGTACGIIRPSAVERYGDGGRRAVGCFPPRASARHEIAGGADDEELDGGLGACGDEGEAGLEGVERLAGLGACALGEDDERLAGGNLGGDFADHVDAGVAGGVAGQDGDGADGGVAHERGFEDADGIGDAREEDGRIDERGVVCDVDRAGCERGVAALPDDADDSADVKPAHPEIEEGAEGAAHGTLVAARQEQQGEADEVEGDAYTEEQGPREVVGQAVVGSAEHAHQWDCRASSATGLSGVKLNHW